MRPPRLPQRLKVPHGQQGEALLVEVIVSSMVLVTAFAMAASMSGITTRALRSSQDLTSVALAVSENMADINDLASRYTFCSGAPGFNPCNGDDPSRATYYTPKGSEALMNTFQTTYCNTKNFNDALIAEINAMPIPTGVDSRTVTQTDYDSLNKRFRVVYTMGTNQRVEVITPNVASFCP